MNGSFTHAVAAICVVPAILSGYNPPKLAQTADQGRSARGALLGDGTTTQNFRIGIGEDSHRTAPGGPLRLGGIEVPHDCHLVGHSDADVLLHAVTDALLGAAALPDIGTLFPNSDPANRNRDSAEMLTVAAKDVRDRNYRIVNLDCVVRAERPKLADYYEAIRHRIAGLLGTSPHQIGIKAKTGEGVGPVGQGELIEARCIALLAEVTN